MERTRVFLMTEQPFFASMLNQCQFNWSTKIKTAAVGFTKAGNVQLLVNKEFFYNLSERHRVGLIQHELLHVALKHLTRLKDLDPQTANVAADIAINQYIPKEYLPKGALLPAQYKLAPNKAFEVYYAALYEKKPKDEPLDDHSSFSNDGQLGENESAGDEAGQDQTTDQTTQGAGISDELANEIQDRITKRAVSEASESGMPGSVPRAVHEELVRHADATKHTVNWKQLLRQYVGRNLSNEYSSTRTRTNRRFGFAAAGKRRVEAPRIIVAVDQSGSISNQDCERLMMEIKDLIAGQDERTEVVYFDTQIQHTEMIRKYSGVVNRYASGGTDFQCVVDHANKKGADLVVFLTDGEASNPIGSRSPMLWVILGGSPTDHLKGSKVHVQD